MQNITKTSPFFCVWRKTVLRKSYLDFSKCSCHLHSYRKIRRCIDKNQTQLLNNETSLTYSIIHTLQKQFNSGKLKVPSENTLCIYSNYHHNKENGDKSRAIAVSFDKDSLCFLVFSTQLFNNLYIEKYVYMDLYINIFNSAFHAYVFIHVSMYINSVNDTTGTR